MKYNGKRKISRPNRVHISIDIPLYTYNKLLEYKNINNTTISALIRHSIDNFISKPDDFSKNLIIKNKNFKVINVNIDDLLSLLKETSNYIKQLKPKIDNLYTKS